MSYPSSTSNKIAIVGGDPLVGRALELSLQSAGYSARFLDGSSVNGAYDPLEGLGLVLLAPRISAVDREAFLRRLRHASSSAPARVPVLELIASSNGARDREEKEEIVVVQRMLWPCQLNDLKQKIETMLLAGSRVDLSPE